MSKNGGKAKVKKVQIPWEIWAKDRITILDKMEQVEFLLDMGYSIPIVATVIGVRVQNLGNWKRKEYIREIEGEPQPFLVCNRFGFKMRMDPKTKVDYLESEARASAIYKIAEEMLNGREKRIFYSVLEGRTLRLVAYDEDLSNSRIGQLFHRAMRKLRWKIRVEHPEWKIL